jgi:hypothetical protein
LDILNKDIKYNIENWNDSVRRANKDLANLLKCIDKDTEEYKNKTEFEQKIINGICEGKEFVEDTIKEINNNVKKINKVFKSINNE